MSGHCPNATVCCNLPCTGGCDSCVAADKASGADGTCGPVKAGADPNNFCSATATNCQTGSCDGASACGFVNPGVACGNGPTCASDVFKAQDTCNAAHSCVVGTSGACANDFSCADGTSCNTACTATGTAPNGMSSGCAAGFYCDTVPATPVCSNTLKAPGATCNNSYECMNGTCSMMMGTCN